MYKLTEEEKADLEDEIFWCRENLKSLVAKLSIATDVKNNLINDISIWKERHERADRKLAFATKVSECY